MTIKEEEFINGKQGRKIERNMAKTTLQEALPEEKSYWRIARGRFDEYRGNLKTKPLSIDGIHIETEKPFIIAGPCTVHSREQTLETAQRVKDAGATMLRGGAYKPRTSPYSFQGLGLEGLEILAEAREITGLPIVTEVMDQRKVEEVGRFADLLQIGARNMQNYALLQDVGHYAAEHNKAVLLKTGPKPKLIEVLCAAEYLAVEYEKINMQPKIVICERGINEQAQGMKNMPRPEFLYQLRKATYLPVIGDPSHSTGKRDFVPRTARSYLAAGANGLIIDVIRDDEKPQINGIDVCDYAQGMRASAFQKFMKDKEAWRVPQR
ncbi:MAG: 3-deoxy-7-phosphoheptulonate synthase [Nanoarchaeota archaeon]